MPEPPKPELAKPELAKPELAKPELASQEPAALEQASAATPVAAARTVIAVQEISPAVRRVYNSLLRRGLLAVIAIQPFFVILDHLTSYSDGATADIQLIPLRGLRWIRVELAVENGTLLARLPFWPLSRKPWRLGTELGEAEISALPLLIFLAQGLAVFLAGAISALEFIPVAIFRALTTPFRLATRSVPILLALLVVIFTTGDAWRLYGSEPWQRFTVLMVIIGAVGMFAVVKAVTDEVRDFAAEQQLDPAKAGVLDWIFGHAEGDAAALQKKSIQALRDAGVTPAAMREQWYWTRFVSWNIKALFWLVIGMQVIAITFWVSVLFVLIGLVAVTPKDTHQLLQGYHTTSLWKFTLFGQHFLLSQQLVFLSVALGGVAVVTFATLGLPDRGSRRTFMLHSVTDLRKALAIMSYYLGCIQDIFNGLEGRQRTSAELIRDLVARLLGWALPG